MRRYVYLPGIGCFLVEGKSLSQVRNLPDVLLDYPPNTVDLSRLPPGIKVYAIDAKRQIVFAIRRVKEDKCPEKAFAGRP